MLPYINEALIPTNTEANDNYPADANMDKRWEMNHAWLDSKVSSLL